MISNRFTDFASPGYLLLVVVLFASETLLLVPNALATRIYKSIDSYGNVTYSSIPPDDAAKVEKIDVPTNFDVDADTADNSAIDKIKATAEELAADRKQREQEREAARKKLAEEKAKTPAEKPPETVIHYYPVYPPYHHYPGKPRPPHPHPPRRPRPQPLAPQQSPAPESPRLPAPR